MNKLNPSKVYSELKAWKLDQLIAMRARTFRTLQSLSQQEQDARDNCNTVLQTIDRINRERNYDKEKA